MYSNINLVQIQSMCVSAWSARGAKSAASLIVAHILAIWWYAASVGATSGSSRFITLHTMVQELGKWSNCFFSSC